MSRIDLERLISHKFTACPLKQGCKLVSLSYKVFTNTSPHVVLIRLYFPFEDNENISIGY